MQNGTSFNMQKLRGVFYMEKDIKEIAMQQSSACEYAKEIQSLAGPFKKMPDVLWSMATVFNYGVIIGIRKERARRKSVKA